MSECKRPGPKLELFPQIDATPEELMRVLVQTPPKDPENWRYAKDQKTEKTVPARSFTGN